MTAHVPPIVRIDTCVILDMFLKDRLRHLAAHCFVAWSHRIGRELLPRLSVDPSKKHRDAGP